MTFNQNMYAGPFWDFITSLDPNRATGQDAAPPFPHFPVGSPFNDLDFDDWNPWSHRGHWARRQRHRGYRNESRAQQNPNITPSDTQQQGDHEMTDPRETTSAGARTPDTISNDGTAPDPAEVTPDESGDDYRPHTPCHPGARGQCGQGRGGPHHGPHHGNHGHRNPLNGACCDFEAVVRNVVNHPLIQNLYIEVENLRPTKGSNSANDNSFSPLIDTFNTPSAYVLHIALPGAKKEDIGVKWDLDTSTLSIAGVVHRPGDEAFLQMLTTGERSVGMFERKVVLPPAGGEREEVDGPAIYASMEDGILIVTVPKLENEWTEIHKNEIHKNEIEDGEVILLSTKE